MELESLLVDDAEFAKRFFGTTPEGNFLEERSRERTGANVLTLNTTGVESEESSSVSTHEVLRIRARLLEARNKRVQPITDDKVLTDWNGMMIAAMARASVLLGERFFAYRAAKAAEALLERFYVEKRLTHQPGKETAFLDDYAFFILALTELNQADFDTSWLRKAKEFADEMLSHFEDKENGGFFMTRDPLPGTGARPRAATDSAHRSGYAAATLALIKLGRLLQKPEYIDSARKAIDAASGDIEGMPTGHIGLLLALDELQNGAEVVVVAASQDEAESAVFELQETYAPKALFIPAYPGCEAPEFASSLPTIDGKTTYYVCRNFACELPTTEIEAAKEKL
jgi:uncharacterized protein YyaL (SSP411 family)